MNKINGILLVPQDVPFSIEQQLRMKSALEFIAAQSDLFFAECSLAEEIVQRAKEALK